MRNRMSNKPDYFKKAIMRGKRAIVALTLGDGGSLTYKQVQELTGIHPYDLEAMAEESKLLRIFEHLFPACQFHNGRVLDGIEEVVKGMSQHGEWVTLSFLTSPSPRIAGDKRPIDLLRAGKKKAVLMAVRQFGEHGG
jgi:hypothetical protein